MIGAVSNIFHYAIDSYKVLITKLLAQTTELLPLLASGYLLVYSVSLSADQKLDMQGVWGSSVGKKIIGAIVQQTQKTKRRQTHVRIRFVIRHFVKKLKGDQLLRTVGVAMRSS